LSLPGGYNPTNIDDDPEFYDDDNDDYHIYSGPCINTGKDLAALTEYNDAHVDLDGLNRPVPLSLYDSNCLATIPT
jgi:hypothetical protein